MENAAKPREKGNQRRESGKVLFSEAAGEVVEKGCDPWGGPTEKERGCLAINREGRRQSRK